MENFGGEILLDEARTISGAARGQVVGFIFDLKLIEDFIASAKRKDSKAKYLLAIKAQNPLPGGETIVITAASSGDKTNFTVVPNERGKVLEHPDTKGKITFALPTNPAKVLDSTQPVTFTIQ